MNAKLECLQIPVSLRGRAKSPRPRRQVKKDRRRGPATLRTFLHRQRWHRALQPEFTLDISSLACLSGAIERVIWIHSVYYTVFPIPLFMQNKANFPHFSTKNDDFTKKQTQFKPNQSQFWPNIKGVKAKTNPIKANFPIPKGVKTDVRFRMSEIGYMSSAVFFLNSVFCILYSAVNKTNPNFSELVEPVSKGTPPAHQYITDKKYSVKFTQKNALFLNKLLICTCF